MNEDTENDLLFEDMNPRPEQRRATAGFITDAKGDFVTEDNTLEREITIRLNAKHPRYGRYIIALDALLHDMQKEPDLICSISGI